MQRQAHWKNVIYSELRKQERCRGRSVSALCRKLSRRCPVSPESTLRSPAASSPTPSAPQVEDFVLDTNLTKSVATWEQLVQEYYKPIVPGFGSLQSYIIPPSYISFEQENKLKCCWTSPSASPSPVEDIVIPWPLRHPKTTQLQDQESCLASIILKDLHREHAVQEKITTASLFYCSHTDTLSERSPEQTSSSEDDDEIYVQITENDNRKTRVPSQHIYSC